MLEVCGALLRGDSADLPPLPAGRKIETRLSLVSALQGWLTSFNCLQEFVYAIEYEKPMAVVVLDQEAW